MQRAQVSRSKHPDARKFEEEILIAISAIRHDRCVGMRLRGDAELKKWCAYHFPEPFKRWRLVYEPRSGGAAPIFISMGEHFQSFAATGAKRRRDLRTRSGLSEHLRWDDAYGSLARVKDLTQAERKSTARALGGIKEERCCESSGRTKTASPRKRRNQQVR